MKSIGDQDNDSNNSRARYSVLCLALVFFFAWNRAEAQNNSWDGLRQLSAGQTIEVVEMLTSQDSKVPKQVVSKPKKKGAFSVPCWERRSDSRVVLQSM